jgi:FKBP-type peptidyl-prolyl cis-trans isomerase FklB
MRHFSWKFQNGVWLKVERHEFLWIRHSVRSWLMLGLALGLHVSLVSAQDQPDLTNQRQRISYALGMDVIRVLKLDDFDIDLKTIAAGMADMQAGRAALTPEQQKVAMREMQADILAKAVAKKEAAGEVHRREGEAFLAGNARKEGVKLKEVIAPDGSKAELQYKILKSGPAGPSPKKTDAVVVRYYGTLIDGTVFDVFDNSVKHGDLATFSMADVIPAWAEALQMMKVGDKWQLFVPPSLAYADYGPPEIGMYTTLIYELELVGISNPNENNSATVSGLPTAVK